jgi:DNA-binding NarL/FixJ family response regulator
MTEKEVYMTKSINVIIADDHQFLVDSMKMLLTQPMSEYQCHVQAVAYTGDELLLLLQTTRPDLLLLDINLPSKTGLEVLKEAKKLLKGTRILALTQYDDPKIIKSAFDNGVDGYMLKNMGRDEFADAIGTVMRGEVYVGKGVSFGNQHVSDSSDFEDVFQKKFSLTKREAEVLRLITQAKNNAVIAGELYISEQTAAVHRKNIMRKIGVNSTAALIRLAFEHSLI